MVADGLAHHTKHAVNVLNKLTAEGRADERWTDEAAYVAAKFRKAAEGDKEAA
jgi:hypothetical protein